MADPQSPGRSRSGLAPTADGRPTPVVVEVPPEEPPLPQDVHDRLVVEVESQLPIPEHPAPPPRTWRYSARFALALAVVVVGSVLVTLERLWGLEAFLLGLLVMVIYVIIGGGSEWLAARLRAAEHRQVERLVSRAAAGRAPVDGLLDAGDRRHRPVPVPALAGPHDAPVIPVNALVHPGFLGLVATDGRMTSDDDAAAFIAACEAAAAEAGGHTADFHPIDPGRSFLSISLRYPDGRRADALLHAVLPYVAFCHDADAEPLRFVDDRGLTRRLSPTFIVLSAATLAQPLKLDPLVERRLTPAERSLLAAHRPATLGEALFNRYR